MPVSSAVKTTMSRNIRTLGDYGNGEGSGNDSGNDDDARQGFYVGGSENSGMQVVGPSRNDDLLRNVFQAARDQGAVSNEENEEERRRRSGRTVGGPAPAAPDADVQHIYMTLWQNGFSIDDGPLRNPTLPESRAFLQHISQGTIPPEIQQQYVGKKIDFHLVSRTDTEYQPPPSKPFQGTGARLGNIVPNLVGEGSSSAAEPAPASSKDQQEKDLQAAKDLLKVDTTQPTTNIQIRLANGQRVIGNFNQSHTVSAIRDFIVTARPEVAFQPFTLMTTFPNKTIEDESVTLKDAGLLNAVVLIKPQN